MTATVNTRYRLDEARFRAEFVRNNKVVDWKYLTNEEHEALDLYFGLPQSEDEVRLNAEPLADRLGAEVDIELDSHFGQMLNDLLKR